MVAGSRRGRTRPRRCPPPWRARRAARPARLARSDFAQRAQLRLEPVDGGDRVRAERRRPAGRRRRGWSGTSRCVGALAVPEIFARTRRRRLSRRAAVYPLRARTRTQTRTCSPLSYLSRNVLALVADALALVWLGRALLADDRGGLADQLLGDALDDHAASAGALRIRCPRGAGSAPGASSRRRARGSCPSSCAR